MFKIKDKLLSERICCNTYLFCSTSDQVLADEFSCYFSNKIQNIREKFPPITSTLNSDPEPASNPEQLSEFLPVSEDEVLKMIKSSPQKSCSLDRHF
jgi:hypothetical protein